MLGDGFKAEDGELLRIEMLCYTSGIGATNGFRIQDAAFNEALSFAYLNDDYTIRSYTAGAPTTIATAELTATSVVEHWARLMFEWNFSDHTYRARAVQMDSAGVIDYGWKTGTANEPTYNTATDMTTFTFYTGATSADQDSGFAQVWIAKGSAHAFPDGDEEARTIDP